MVRAEACGCAGPARVLVRQPCLVFWLSLLVSLLLSVLPLLLFGMFEIDFTTDNFQVRGNDVANKYHAVQLAMEGTTLDDDRRRRALAEDRGGGRRLQDDGACNRFIDVFFHTGDGGDIFTGARIAEASRLQARLLEISGVRRVALSTIDALAGMGAAELANATASLASAKQDEDWSAWPHWTANCPDWVPPAEQICTPAEDEHGEPHLEWADTEAGPSAYFARDFSSCDPISSVIRVKAEVCAGWEAQDRQEVYDQVAALNDDADAVLLAWKDREFDSWQQEQQMMAESGWLAGVMIVVFILVLVQTSSFFIAAMGFIEILLSCPLGYFVYRVLAGVKYVSAKHLS